MKSLPTPLADHLASGTTTLAWCWRLTRRDGQVFGFTDHDEHLSFDDTSFEPESGLVPSELRAGDDLSVDAQDAEGVLSSDRITETDIYDGLWDDASVEVWRVNWEDATERLLMRKGTVGQIRRGRAMFVAEVRSMAHLLQQSMGRTFQYGCDAALGDARCGVALGNSTYTGTGAVDALVHGRTFTASGLDAFADGWFSGGTLEWLTGANAGRKVEVMLHSNDADVRLTLQYAPVRDIATGDTFTVQAGCDKTTGPGGCARFENIANFRGFPHIPGNDTILRYARRTGRNQGEPL
ncbi:DUF2163 domain-containing protein [Leisingera daeponensis]|uniref:DUF2163 domain-containing protein n=1 Tax=Leisingera daeponensis TaxID=405746 RepID=UPI001C96050C|nr:DUF2163 domain-containing protein [Leisingera daeponensis]MBY6055377.1 DUF2163 domain-containing protein [Leisingera daeponensis]